MTAQDCLDAGELAPAIERLVAEVKAQPDDARRRTFLFELLCFAGELERAGRQLDVIGHQAGPTGLAGVQVYRNLLEAETKRARLFDQGLRPRFLLEPPPSVALVLEALEGLRSGRPHEARAALDRGESLRRPCPGRAGGVAFDDIRDADDLLGPVLEVFAPAGYVWVAWEHVQYLEVLPPKRLRDLLWAPARLATFDGQLGEVFLPNLYPGSSFDPDDLVRLGRKTDWQETAPGIVRGVGQKLFLVGDELRNLFELGEVQLAPPPSEPAQENP